MTKTEELNNIKYYAGIVGDIFAGANKEVCSDCPMASLVPNCTLYTVKDARKHNVIYSKETGCCSNCSHSGGYLSVSYERRLELKRKFNFDEKYGFFDNNKKSCKLPRYLRSSICLNYSCRFLKDKLKIKYGQQILSFIAELCDGITISRGNCTIIN